ncbi:LAG1 longevity assurance like protein 6 [Fukomys damarensis]|uniref:LAG1 longevity assurance like protein 6 n=1 Tax=Fukomys damarensis TaxID=885580 RepID=A0A091DI42_FUKDA|nr:LAG1 longevity assurance like protein 6 [Fukomys damarensis]
MMVELKSTSGALRKNSQYQQNTLPTRERFIAKPCAIALNIQASGPQIAPPNAILEKVFTAITKHPDEKRLEGLSKQLDWDVQSIQRWFRQRRNQEKPSTLTRFCESISQPSLECGLTVGSGMSTTSALRD